MKRTVICGILTCAVAGTMFCSGALSNGTIDVCITVSPSTIVLGLDKGAAVTVHTDIPLGAVDRASVALSGVPAALTKADNRGNLVAKFRQEAIEALVAPPEATLVLTGMTRDGVPFSGSDTVRVIEDPSPQDQ
jgi:hypothetical protein